jgi:hypothetical protein
VSSDIEQALDEILSGVNALLEQAPAGSPRVVPGTSTAALDHSSAFDMRPSVFTEDSELLSLLAVTASDSRRAHRHVAQRLLLRLLTARAVMLGTGAGDLASVTISPLLSDTVSRLLDIGARPAHSDAVSLFWDFSGVSAADPVRVVGRFACLLCPVQKETRALVAMPRFPERLRVRWLDHFEGKSTASTHRSQQAAVIDQDNPSAELVTILWLTKMSFVPDQWLGVTFREGQLCPVLHVESGHTSID